MEILRRFGPLIGRILIALIFLLSGYGKVTGFEGTVDYIASKSLPMPEVAAIGAIIVEICGGLMLVFGWRTRLAATALFIFTGLAALFFHNFSTFLGKPGIYLEDLFVLPEFRSKGIGKALLIHLARLAIERGCGRFEWAVLDWNESAREFYKRLGAVPLEDLTVFRLTGEALKQPQAHNASKAEKGPKQR